MVALLALAMISGPAQGAILATEGDTAEINGAHFTLKSGFHTTDTFLDIGGGSASRIGGHNTSGDRRNDENQGTTDLTLGDIPVVTRLDRLYFQILVDLNETGSDKAVNLDELQVFTSPSAGNEYEDGDPIVDPLEALSFSLGLLRFDLDALSDDVLTADQFAPGSNAVDLEILLPVSMFAGASATDYAYVYVEMSGTDGGPERWVLDEDNVVRHTFSDPPLPEPSSIALIALGLIAATGRRRG